jgi:hypothetical protein
LRIWLHLPSLHCSHADLREGVSARGNFLPLIISIIEFFLVHQKDSFMISDFDRI